MERATRFELATFSLGIKIIGPLFSPITKLLRKNQRACNAYRACYCLICVSLGDVGGRCVSSDDGIEHSSGSSEWLVQPTILLDRPTAAKYILLRKFSVVSRATFYPPASLASAINSFGIVLSPTPTVFYAQFFGRPPS